MTKWNRALKKMDIIKCFLQRMKCVLSTLFSVWNWCFIFLHMRALFLLLLLWFPAAEQIGLWLLLEPAEPLPAILFWLTSGISLKRKWCKGDGRDSSSKRKIWSLSKFSMKPVPSLMLRPLPSCFLLPHFVVETKNKMEIFFIVTFNKSILKLHSSLWVLFWLRQHPKCLQKRLDSLKTKGCTLFVALMLHGDSNVYILCNSCWPGRKCKYLYVWVFEL